MITFERLLQCWMGGLLLCGLLFLGVCFHWAWSWAKWRWSLRDVTRIPTRWL